VKIKEPVVELEEEDNDNKRVSKTVKILFVIMALLLLAVIIKLTRIKETQLDEYCQNINVLNNISACST